MGRLSTLKVAEGRIEDKRRTGEAERRQFKEEWEVEEWIMGNKRDDVESMAREEGIETWQAAQELAEAAVMTGQWTREESDDEEEDVEALIEEIWTKVRSKKDKKKGKETADDEYDNGKDDSQQNDNNGGGREKMEREQR